MTITIPNRDNYLAKLLTTVGKQATADWLVALRSQSTAFLQEETIPSTKDEEWRFTSLKGLLAQDFALPSGKAPADLQPVPGRLVFVDGVYAPQLSQPAKSAGLFVGGLSEAIKQKPAITEYLGKQPGGEEIFTALNTSGFSDAAVIWVEGDITEPIHLLFVGTGASSVNQPRVLVVAAKNSRSTIIEEYVSSNGIQFTNAVTEISVAPNACVNHIRLQEESPETFHIGKTAISQAEDSQYHGYAISLGSKLARHHWEVYQTGKQTDTTLNGLDLIAGEQVSDTHSKIALNHPHGRTNQLHKSVVTGKAHAIFSGKVLVPQGAQQTNAAQLSRTLLLSPKARVDTKPQLEITADDVKCSHGATVSQLSDDELFYLQSRGLGIEISRTLLVNAFAIEVIENLPVPAIRDRLILAVQNFQP
jgi:Fe-S cluster assembly protein SufD